MMQRTAFAMVAAVFLSACGDVVDEPGNVRNEVAPGYFHSLNAASYHWGNGGRAVGSLVYGAGQDLTDRTEEAHGIPLPTTLAGVSVRVTDSAGARLLAGLLYASPDQINYEMPADVALGPGVASVMRDSTVVAEGPIDARRVDPGLFRIGSQAERPGAGYVLRVKADGTRKQENIARYDIFKRDYVPAPISFGAPSDQLFLVFYGTGIRNRAALETVTVYYGNRVLPTLYAGAQGDYVGLDQVNVSLDRSLANLGRAPVYMDVEEPRSNSFTLEFRE